MNLWFPYLRRAARPVHRLFCMHHAGGSASAFHPWIEPLASHGIELWALQLPGRENRAGERPYEDMTTAARACVGALLSHLDAPYALFGHSIGAKLAFAVAQVLAGTSAPSPAHLVLSGARAPSYADDDRLFHDLSREDLVQALEQLGGTPPELLARADFVDYLTPVLRADLRLSESNRLLRADALDVAVSVFGGVDDTDVTAEHLSGWLACTRAPRQVHRLPGGHFFLFDPENRMPERIARLVWSDS